MKFSIITTSYNSEKYIEETLESVLSQRGDFEIEYIIYDANSNDTTWEKILKYKNLVEQGFFEGRNLGITMKIFQEADNGMYEGILKGFTQATGDIVAYINSDDFYLPNAFSCVSEIFTKFSHINWLTGRVNMYNSKGHNYYNKLYLYKRKDILKGIYGTKKHFIEQESCFWRINLLEEINKDTFKNFKLAGDFYLWHTFAKKHELYSINSVLSGFRKLENQKSANIENYMKEFNSIIKNSKKEVNDIIKTAKLEKMHNLVLEYRKNEWTLGYTHIKLNFLGLEFNINKSKLKFLGNIKEIFIDEQKHQNLHRRA